MLNINETFGEVLRVHLGENQASRKLEYLYIFAVFSVYQSNLLLLSNFCH